MIKKIALLFVSLLFFSITINAQPEFKKEWNVGVGGGMNFSSIDFVTQQQASGSLNTKNMGQTLAGISLRYITEKNLGFIVELNYSQQGWDEDFRWAEALSQLPTFMHRHKLNYVDIPFLTHIYFGNKFRFFINLGPKISFLLSDSEEISDGLIDFMESGQMSGNVSTYQYGRMADKKLDYGLMGGLGLELRTGIGNFALEGRYYYGLADIYNSSKAAQFQRSANRVISAKLTYYVKLF